MTKLDSFSDGERAILATVVDVLGSGYRRPGAKMLIAENGTAYGTVSGGCLEADVLARAKKLLKSGESEVLTYDTTTGPVDSVFSLNMGCSGIVRILIEPVEKDEILFRSWRLAHSNRQRQLIATLISAENNQPVGGRIYYNYDKNIAFQNLPKSLESSDEILDLCSKFFDNNEPAQTFEFELGDGNVEIFYENIEPPLNLFIFGAGFDAVPLAVIAKNLGWRVSIVDHRPAFATSERFPGADEIIVSPIEDIAEMINPDHESVAVVMTHNYEKDRGILRYLLKRGLSYIGALGPKKRTESLLEELKAGGLKLEDSELERLHAPVGLDIGADTPEAIALSIAAEIRAVLAARNGGFLRDRNGPIYERRGESNA